MFYVPISIYDCPEWNKTIIIIIIFKCFFFRKWTWQIFHWSESGTSASLPTWIMGRVHWQTDCLNWQVITFNNHEQFYILCSITLLWIYCILLKQLILFWNNIHTHLKVQHFPESKMTLNVQLQKSKTCSSLHKIENG